jgi:hypothetical protein
LSLLYIECVAESGSTAHTSSSLPSSESPWEVYVDPSRPFFSVCVFLFYGWSRTPASASLLLQPPKELVLWVCAWPVPTAGELYACTSLPWQGRSSNCCRVFPLSCVNANPGAGTGRTRRPRICLAYSGLCGTVPSLSTGRTHGLCPMALQLWLFSFVKMIITCVPAL